MLPFTIGRNQSVDTKKSLCATPIPQIDFLVPSNQAESPQERT